MSWLSGYMTQNVTLTEQDLQGPPDTRNTLQRAKDSTGALLDRMETRASMLDLDIAAKQEELRQVRLVIDGAQKMMETISDN